LNFKVRETFGKRLADHQAIAFKVAEMVRRIEGIHAHLEQVKAWVRQRVRVRCVRCAARSARSAVPAGTSLR
jgi:alkylation response protein AidB-like acyl-CoA dehydrogenase